MKKTTAMLLCALFCITLCVNVSAHPGRTDARGGHYVRTEGWGYPLGTYHFHSRYETIIPANYETGEVIGITVIVDGENIIFDQPPVNINGRVLVPIRPVVEKMGCLVEWDDETETVYVNEPHISIEKTAVKADFINVYVNNEQIVFDDPPIILNGRTLIPIRYVVEKLGYTAEWDGDLQIVYIVKRLLF